ncbi:MAG: rhomboid family intramembrane serine protease [Planctomycetes bacterium]|nr:rhomboid family intramembrane serine protease [Planctomycetota bacterium]
MFQLWREFDKLSGEWERPPGAGMGIQDRDYYREGSSFLDAWNRQGVTVWLIAITCGVFFGQCITGHPMMSPLVGIGRYDPQLVQDGEFWRLFTPMFLHASLWHLFWNMLALYFVGTRLEDVYGRSEFVAFYLCAGIFAQVFSFLAWSSGLMLGNPSIGASGAVSAAMVVYAFHYPHQKLYLYFLIPVPVWLLVIVYLCSDMLGAFGAINGPIAYFVHLGGAFFGAFYYQLGWRLIDLFPGSRRTARARSSPRLRVVPADAIEDTPTPVRSAVESASRAPEPRTASEPGDDSLEKRLDQVLAKVSKFGQGSLTPEEREILFKASELYKKRRK